MDTIAILGNDYQITTAFVLEIIKNTKAKSDQEHLKMNIIIDNKLLEKSDSEIIKILKQLESIASNSLVVTFNNERVLNIIEKYSPLSLLNKEFNLNDLNLIKKIVTKDVKS